MRSLDRHRRNGERLLIRCMLRPVNAGIVVFSIETTAPAYAQTTPLS